MILGLTLEQKIPSLSHPNVKTLDRRPINSSAFRRIWPLYLCKELRFDPAASFLTINKHVQLEVLPASHILPHRWLCAVFSWHFRFFEDLKPGNGLHRVFICKFLILQILLLMVSSHLFLMSCCEEDVLSSNCGAGHPDSFMLRLHRSQRFSAA